VNLHKQPDRWLPAVFVTTALLSCWKGGYWLQHKVDDLHALGSKKGASPENLLILLNPYQLLSKLACRKLISVVVHFSACIQVMGTRG